jgi:glycosyltransferase involved in cell wall biosynthesis
MNRTEERVGNVSAPLFDSVLVYQLGLPHYRQAMLDILASSSPNIRFFVGDKHFMDFVTTGVAGSNVISSGSNVFMLGRRFAWQRIDIRAATKARLVVLELNPRILSTWVVLITRRILNRPTIAWGQVFGRQGSRSKTERLRRFMRQLFDGLIAYTESERSSFHELHPDKECWVAANAIYRRDEMVTTSDGPIRNDFTYIGRLVAEKRPHLALEAFRILANLHPEARLTYIGEGPERERLEADVARMRLGEKVRVLGHVSDWATLRGEFAKTVATVCPGYAGLNITQSLGFGVPVIYAGGEPNAPEIEALNEGNSIEFVAHDAESLAEAMASSWSAKDAWASEASEISAQTRSRYSAEAMATAFEAASRFEGGRSSTRRSALDS